MKQQGARFAPTLCRLAATVILVSLATGTAFAQESLEAGEPPNPVDLVGEGVSIRTTGGGAFQGTLFGVQPDRYEIVLADGEILQISRSEVVELRVLDNRTGSRSFYEDSASNRLVIMPTGFPMDRGEFQIANQEIIAVTGSYGINNWLSVWGGVSIPGALFSLRASLRAGESIGLSAGSFVGASWLDLDFGPLVLPYALVSYGENDNNLTVGSGFMMTFSEGFNIPGAVVAIGGKRTLTATTAVVSENWIVWAERSYFDATAERSVDFWTPVPLVIAPSLVFRIANNRLSWDIGAVVPFIIQNEDNQGFYLNDPVIPIPVLSVTYRIR